MGKIFDMWLDKAVAGEILCDRAGARSLFLPRNQDKIPRNQSCKLHFLAYESHDLVDKSAKFGILNQWANAHIGTPLSLIGFPCFLSLQEGPLLTQR
jgi:hypothetical protein